MTSPQESLPLDPPAEEHLTVSALENWLWDAACKIRGATDAPKYKDFILPLVFYKRLSDVFDDELKAQEAVWGDLETAREVVAEDHADALQNDRKPILRFYVPEEYSWRRVREHAEDKLGEFVTDAMRAVATANPELKGVLDVKDYAEKMSGQRTLDDSRLSALVEVVSRHRLGLRNTKPDVLGDAYEYLLRKFAEGQGQSAGEFFTPMEVSLLTGELLDPKPLTTVYDPTCGSAGLLIKARIVFDRDHPDQKSQAPKLFGQELNAVTYAIAKMNMFLHDFQGSQFAIGDTFKAPGFGAAASGLQRFRYVVANPMWNQSGYDPKFYADDTWNRFGYGAPPPNNADWAWMQHILASLDSEGRAAVVLDTGAASRGSGGGGKDKERDIRKQFVEHDWVEGVVLLPENLFYNTTAPGVIFLLNRDKPAARRGQIILLNASALFVKKKPKNVLTEAGRSAVVEAFRSWATRDKLSRVVTLEEVRAADYNLSPSQFVEVGERLTHRPMAEILTDLDVARAERGEADARLACVLARLGLVGATV